VQALRQQRGHAGISGYTRGTPAEFAPHCARW
jgi:hypothetical protein